jgi:hypothetical protein
MPETARTVGGAGASNGVTPADYAALVKLKSDYAIATDVMTAGDVARGIELYRRSFTQDAEIAAGFDEANPLMKATGPDAWGEAVQAAVAGMFGSQHLIGTIAIEPGDDADTAHITAYFQATVLAELDKTMTTYVGTYFDQARRIDGRWWLTRSFSKYLAVETSTRDAP